MVKLLPFLTTGSQDQKQQYIINHIYIYISTIYEAKWNIAHHHPSILSTKTFRLREDESCITHIVIQEYIYI